MCLVLMLSFAACKNKDGGSDTTAPDTTEGTTSSLEDIINALNGVDTTDSSNPASTTEATEPETMPKGHEIKDNGAKKDIKKDPLLHLFPEELKARFLQHDRDLLLQYAGRLRQCAPDDGQIRQKSLYEHESSCRQRRINDNVVHFGRR